MEKKFILTDKFVINSFGIKLGINEQIYTIIKYSVIHL